MAVESHTKPEEILNARLVTINYEQLGKHKDVLKQVAWDCVVVDESHMMKEKTTQRTQNVFAIFGKVSHRVCLSGTPIKSRPREFYTTLNFLAPDRFNDEKGFLFRYCGAFNNGYGWSFNGSSNLDELYEKVNDIMIRRLKSEVLTDLPAKLVSTLDVSMESSQEAEYAKMVSELYRQLEGLDISKTLLDEAHEVDQKFGTEHVLAQITKMKVWLSRRKVEYAIELANTILENGEKVVFVSQYRETQKALREAFAGRCAWIDGDLNALKKQEMVDRFQNDPTCDVMVNSTIAGGVGVTLTAASKMIVLDYMWTPGEMQQVEDRLHRIGQKGTVNIYNLVVKGTIEEHIENLLESKRQVIEQTLDGAVKEKVKHESIFGEFLARQLAVAC